MFNHRAGVKVSRNAWERRFQVRCFCHPAFPGLKDRLFPWERLFPGQKDAYRDFKESGAKVIADSLRKVMHSVDTIPVSTAECEERSAAWTLSAQIWCQDSLWNIGYFLPDVYCSVGSTVSTMEAIAMWNPGWLCTGWMPCVQRALLKLKARHTMLLCCHFGMQCRPRCYYTVLQKKSCDHVFHN